jgi:hypothetical protein
MADFPKITTAIPKKRLVIGEYVVTILGEIESPDFPGYFLIAAFVPEGKSEPVLFLCAEKTLPKERHEGQVRLRVVNQAMSEVLEIDDKWRDLATFSEQAIPIGAQLLGVQNEQVVTLMG